MGNEGHRSETFFKVYSTATEGQHDHGSDTALANRFIILNISVKARINRQNTVYLIRILQMLILDVCFHL